MANCFCFSKNWSTFAHEMKKLMFLLLMAVWSVNSLAQEWAGVPENRFAVTVRIDSAIASEPQKM